MERKIRVLFVDDEPFVLQGLQRLLRPMRSEWDMAFVDSGAQGLQVLAAEPYDVVVADMRMPGMNGAEFLQKVMERHPATIRLVLSGHADQELILQVEGAAHQFLSKPCDPDLLRAVIRTATQLGDKLPSERMRRVLGSIAHVPVLPAVYQEIVDLLARESSTVEALGQIVMKDPGLTANILKLVNSAYFGLRQEVSDPAEAVSFLGVETLKSLALLHGVFQQVQSFPACISRAHLWQHSLDLAAASREIARREGFDRAAQSACYTSGLLHDVGLLVLGSGFPKEYGLIAETLRQGTARLVDAERQVLGVHHGEAGGHLLGLWGLPPVIVEAVAGHHAPPAEGPVGPARIVNAAECLSANRGDYLVFGILRHGEDEGLRNILGPRFESWGQIVAEAQASGRAE